MSDRWQRFTLWCLRRFRLFREMEARCARRLELMPPLLYSRCSVGRVEAELERVMLLNAPLAVQVLPTKTEPCRDLGLGQLRAVIQEGMPPR